MSNRNRNRVQAWGIAEQSLDGSLNLIYATMGRQDARNYKREVYPGGSYKLVRINATFETYKK